MLTARLESPSMTPVEFQSPRFEGIGPALATSDGHLVAVQRGGIWMRGRAVYASVHFIGAVRVTLFNPDLEMSVEFGPLSNARVIDSSLWQEGERQQLFARFDEALGVWHVLAEPSAPMSHFTVRPD